MTSERRASGPWLHRYAGLVAGATFLLLIAGGLVTSTGSGLAVPDWPLSFGQVFPRMAGGVLFEHGHRMVATVVGLLTLVLAAWTARAEPRAAVRRLGWALLGVVVLQGVLGGTTVLLRLPIAVSVAHAALAQLFFALTVLMFAVTSPAFPEQGAAGLDRGTPSVRTLSLVLVIAVYVQILVGAVVRHLGAGLAIPDFPLSYGRIVPAFTSALVIWQYAHRVLALLVAVLLAWTAAAVLARFPGRAVLVRPAVALLVLVVLQILLGGVTIWSRRGVLPTTAHVATGALLFITAVLLAARARRMLT